MPECRHSRRPALLETVDHFVGAVPLKDRRVILVHRREHGGREFVTLRVFLKHLIKNCWYPTNRSFGVRVELAEDLADAIRAAARGGRYGSKPEWYEGFVEQYGKLGRAAVLRS